MSIILVSRHMGTLDWFEKKGFKVDQHVVHFEIEMVQSGDVVLGALPIHLIAQVCALGASYYHLDLVVPFEWRGKELTAQQLDAFGAELVPYYVKRC